MEVHLTPFGIDIGRGTMISDGATLIDADYSSTSFRVTSLSIGPRNFLGNAIAYPAGGRTGENCLIATKAMVPLDGPVRANVGLLGSPCFEIPRSVTSDPRFDHLRTGEEFRRRLRAKNRHNLDTMGLFLAVRWVHAFVITLLAMAAVGTLPWQWSSRTRRADCRDAAVQLRVLHHGRAGADAIQIPAAAVLLHLRPVLLVARALLETDGAPHRHAQRHPVKEPGLAPGRRPDRSAGLRRRVLHRRADTWTNL